MMIRKGIPFIFLVLICFLPSCKKEIVPDAFVPRSAHEAYGHMLGEAGLAQTALGRDWIRCAERAMAAPVGIDLPFEEEYLWDERRAEASGYQFHLPRGLRVMVQLEREEPDSANIFIDAFRNTGDSLRPFLHVASADSTLYLEFEARRESHFTLRVQPELLRGGRFNLRITAVPSLGFPVRGKDSRSIQSFFGDPRDGGSREHHGVDIFAARHTPVLAPSDARVTRVDTSRLGGRHVWLYDNHRALNLYFAHLEEQLVAPQQMVRRGDTIGTVGNTGNARYTPPHLHFGIYSRGPVDPWHFIVETDTIPDGMQGAGIALGAMASSVDAGPVRSGPSEAGIVIDTITSEASLQIMARTGDDYRIEYKDGISGYMPVDQVRPHLNQDEGP